MRLPVRLSVCLSAFLLVCLVQKRRRKPQLSEYLYTYIEYSMSNEKLPKMAENGTIELSTAAEICQRTSHTGVAMATNYKWYYSGIKVAAKEVQKVHSDNPTQIGIHTLNSI